VKALTLWQPWASLIALGEKRIETRCWATKYRGNLAIHAAAKLPPNWLGASRLSSGFRLEMADALRCRAHQVDQKTRELPYGAVVCIVELVSIEPTHRVEAFISQRERVFGNYEDGRFAWHLRLLKVFVPPVPAKGNRLLWNWETPL
jgi:activating signal cointegrator 1